MKGRLERTRLGDVAMNIREVYTPRQCFLQVKLDMDTIQKLQVSLIRGEICLRLDFV